ncbi:FAD binding domain-containing protein [Pseudonocardia kunmingensis]|uniref:Xanthine dehydrogenase YagS FAD-binding subunit n=1 Tax=Pseudonocardia kunmingensis TaxID=630975 RepID=A0A543D9W9_9PSEU|nr:xanthine dehydrogenase family protein subunit M [Pseudonocardia kunmingensis]TQM06143.1 xanthine dehydrogenase YagS FAD-binding subunit [Pseudonocardia kunmingensis]
MRPFGYVSAPDLPTALDVVAAGARPLGGGTNLVDLMREDVERPETLVDLTRLPLTDIEELQEGGGLRIGALVRNGHLAAHRLVRSRYPVLTQALLSGASGQLRNMATVGGNLVQRTRCPYFRDRSADCNKREPGTGCAALGGVHRGTAVLGTSEHCIAAHASDMAVALVALDAVVVLESVRGARRVPVAQLHRLPGDTPHVETELAADELITSVELPAAPVARTSRYRKVRDRASFAFALVAVAAALEVQDGEVTDVRLALGGVAPRPWRASEAERLLLGAPATEESFRRAAAAELAPAVGRPQNEFKIELAQRTVVAVLRQLAEGSAA